MVRPGNVNKYNVDGNAGHERYVIERSKLIPLSYRYFLLKVAKFRDIVQGLNLDIIIQPIAL